MILTMRGLVAFFLLFFFVEGSPAAYTILLDPGHGGEETGARTGGNRPVYEKDIALKISRKIHRHLKKMGHRAWLTRSIDRTVTLRERAALAEKLAPDIYVSVHVNSSKNTGVQGFETYYLDNHNNAAVRKLERSENASWTKGDWLTNQILRDLIVERTVHTSRPLANSIHREIRKTVGASFGLPDRGVRPGLFYVLALAKRPAVLLEVGFLSNSKELRKILNPNFQERYALSVARGIHRYVKTRR